MSGGANALRVGVVGLGAMGLPMAGRLVEAGFAVAGFDPGAAQREAFAARGGRIAQSPAEAAQGAAALLVMTATGAQAEAALFGAAGAVAALAPGAVVLLCCTQSPAGAEALCRRLAEAGHLPMDAPVSGGVVGAEAGRLTVMASGSDEAFARAKPLTDVLAGTLVDLGRSPGLGSTLKAVNQLAAGAHIAVAAEALALAAKAGLDPALARDVLMSGAAASWMMGNRSPRMLEREPPVASAVDIFVKDLGIVEDLGRALRQPTPIAAAALQMFLAASAGGAGRSDDSQVVRVYEVLGAVSVRR